jgi:hypothetical protein
LFYALKGGGNQFGMNEASLVQENVLTNAGIVTNFKVQTYPMGKVYGGVKIFSAKHTKEYFAALRSYAEDSDPKTAIIGLIATTGANHHLSLVQFYDGEKAPAGAFGKFEAIPPLQDLSKTRNYPNLVFRP